MPRYACVLTVFFWANAQLAHAQWAGHERLTRQSLVERLDREPPGVKAELPAKDLSNLDLSGVDFHSANLSASVFNGANLTRAKLDGCNLTVTFFEGADPKFSVGIVDLHAVGQASNVVQQRAGFYQPDPTGSASRFQDP